MRWCSTTNDVALARDGSPPRIDCGMGGLCNWIPWIDSLGEPTSGTQERAGLISAVYVVSFLVFSIPAVVARVLATHIGLRETSLGYGSLIVQIAFSA